MTKALRYFHPQGFCVETVYEAVKKISIEPKGTVGITKGRSAELVVSVSPKNATNQTLRWESNNERIATVTQWGTVTALREGACTVTVHATDGGEQRADLLVMVEPSVPLNTPEIVREGYFGFYTDLYVRFENTNFFRTVTYIDFTVFLHYGLFNQKSCHCTTECRIGPRKIKKLEPGACPDWHLPPIWSSS